MESQRILLQKERLTTSVKRAIKPDDIMNIIDSLPLKLMETEKLCGKDLRGIKRFFLKQRIPRLTFFEISRLTGGACHATSLLQIKHVTTDKRFDNIKEIINYYIDLFESRSVIS